MLVVGQKEVEADMAKDSALVGEPPPTRDPKALFPARRWALRRLGENMRAIHGEEEGEGAGKRPRFSERQFVGAPREPPSAA